MLRDQDAFARDLDWNLLKLFFEIVRHQGLTPAAAALNRKQPTLSLALRRLEDRLGTRLCDRGPGGFRLTNEGLLLAETCASLQRLIGQAQGRLHSATPNPRGRLRLQLISNVVAPRLDKAIAAFHTAHPRVELVIDVATWAGVTASLLRKEIDLGIAPARFHHAELHYERLFREINRPYCGRLHPLYRKHVARPRDLSPYPFVLTGADEPDELTRYRMRHGLGNLVAGVSDHLEEAKRLCLLGVGLCFLPDAFAAPDVAAGNLWSPLPARRGPVMDFFLMTNPSAPSLVARDLFVAMLHKLYAERRPQAPKKH